MRRKLGQVVATLLVTLLLLHGCSGITPYRSAGEKNLQIRSALAGASASIDVYRVDASCGRRHEGTIALDSARIDVGLPPGRPSLLVVTFKSSSWLGPRHSMSREAWLTPRRGRHYRMELTYRNDIYNVVVRELGPGKRAGVELELRDAGTCR